MHRKTLLASALAVLIAGSTSFVMAQNTPPPPSPTPSAMAGKDMRAHHGDRGDHGMRMHRFDHQRSGVIGDLHGLERLYMQAGRSKEMASVYNDVLARSQDPRVRDYVYQRLARLQAQPANVDQAIATLRKGLDENLANEAKMRAEHEKMRAAWQQRAGGAAPPPK
jgi:Spy/CpxP family protein refolding chaperone